jgi:hypothetical protein
MIRGTWITDRNTRYREIERMNKLTREYTRAYESLIFLHIPKTGGVTLNKIIRRQYPHKAIFSIATSSSAPTVEDFIGLSESRRDKIRFLTGHMLFGQHIYLRQPSIYITLLRDPADRIISHYYYVLRNPLHYLYEQVIKNRMTLDDYVASGISSELINGQTKTLAGNEQMPPADALECAKKNLRDHCVFGLTDRFDESLMMIKKRLGWNNVYYAKENATRDRPAKTAIPQNTISRIMQLNAADVQLYKFASQLFEDRIQEEFQFLPAEVEKFRSRNKVYSRFYQIDLSRIPKWFSRRILGRP